MSNGDSTTTRAGVATWERLLSFQRRAQSAMDASLRSHHDHTLEEYDVLHQIAQHGEPIRMGELAASLVVANSSCHRLVGRLVDGGYVVRHRGDEDRREVKVELTAEGKRLRRRMATRHTRDIHDLFSRHLTIDELSELDQILERLDSIVSDRSAPRSN